MFTLLRKLYNWVLNWSKSPFGIYALFILSFLESFIFPIPPDVLLIALAVGSRLKALKFALICSLGSIIGAIVGYSIGFYLWWDFNGISDFFYNNISSLNINSFNNIKLYYEKYGFLIIFTAGFTPLPFKLITISSGAFNISFPIFIIASTLSRSSRFLLIAFLINKYGIAIESFIDKYFNILSLLFIFILFSAYLFIELFIN